MNYALPESVASALSGKFVLVTGSEGFLGKHLVRALRSVGALVSRVDVVGHTDRNTSYASCGAELFIPTGIYDYVIHGAGIASPFHYLRSPMNALEASVAGLRNILSFKPSRLLFLSSSEIYGDPTIVPTPETYTGASDTMGPRACYDEGKRLGETLCYIASQRGQHATVVRLFNAFGPGMRDDDRRFMPELRNAKRAGRPMRIYGSGDQTRTFCFVTDAVRGCLQALISGEAGRAYNIGNDRPELSMRQVCELAGVPVEAISPPPEWPSAGDPNRRCPDISRARAELGYEPVVPFEAGLRAFLDDDSDIRLEAI